MKFKSVIISVIVTVYLFKKFSDIDNGCLLCLPSDSPTIFREPVDCSMCIDVHQVDRIENISQRDFFENYYSKIRPVIVTDATENWEATKLFDFNFFKHIYFNIQGAIELTFDCQFFPYQTEFRSLYEVFKMDKNRSELVPGTKPWYVGWSNCHKEVGKKLRKYYDTPYFIPSFSENLALSWTFMGGPGFGAQMHVDNVIYPSWQAQLRGKKKWKLAPPPECYYVCKELEVTVQPKEIIVVDTNRWYHQTFVLPGDISITIGSEFD